MKFESLASVSSVSDEDPIDDLFPSYFPLNSYPRNNTTNGGVRNNQNRNGFGPLLQHSNSNVDLSNRPATGQTSSSTTQFTNEYGLTAYPGYQTSLTPSRSAGSSAATYIIDDAVSGTGIPHIIDDYDNGYMPKRHTELRRSLKTRHIQMIAVGGVLGNGLFIGAGKLLGNSGPLGLLLGFLITGLIVFSVMVSFGEMVALIPIAGGISAFGARFVDDALGFALGFCYWFSLAVAIPTQIASAAFILTYFRVFDPWNTYPVVLTVSFLFLIILINSFRIRIYGEIEYAFGQIKLLLLFGLIIFMFVLNRNYVEPEAGNTTIYPVNFLFWNSSANPNYGPFRPSFFVTDTKTIDGPTGRLLMIWTTVVQAVYSFSGTELVALTAGEALNPRKSLPRATLRIFTRIFILYILAVFAIGLNVYAGDSLLPNFFTPWNVFDSERVSWIWNKSGSDQCPSGSITIKGFSSPNTSPWIVALHNAGLCVGASIVACLFMFCAWSAGNSYLYASSRTLYALGIQGKVPAIFGLCTKQGIPYVAVLFTSGVAMTVFLVSFPNSTSISIYYWIRKLTSVPGTLVWAGMCLSYIRFYYGLRLRPDIVQRDMPSYPFRSPFQPYTAYFGLIGCILLVIFNDMTIFVEFQWQYFVSSYISLLLFFVCFLGYKFWRRTRIVPLSQLELDLGRREMDQYEAETTAELERREKGFLSRRSFWRWFRILIV
ncbi:amino acid permease-domain-containing protein [Dipodascopsis uninucleata]